MFICHVNLQYMDYDYHASFERLAAAYKDAEAESCEAVMTCARSVVDQAKGLSFENDLHYFLSENPGPFTPPNPFSFLPYEGDDVSLHISLFSLYFLSLTLVYSLPDSTGAGVQGEHTGCV